MNPGASIRSPTDEGVLVMRDCYRKVAIASPVGHQFEAPEVFFCMAISHNQDALIPRTPNRGSQFHGREISFPSPVTRDILRLPFQRAVPRGAMVGTTSEEKNDSVFVILPLGARERLKILSWRDQSWKKQG